MSIGSRYQQIFLEFQKLLGDYKPAECKDLLWKFFALTVSGGFNRQPVEKREEFLAFYEHLKQLFDVLDLLESELKQDRETNRLSIKNC